MKFITDEQGSDAWFSARLGLATASCFSSILATVKYGEAAVRRNYRARLVVERLTGKPISTFETDAMRLGREREPMARAAYELRSGNWVTEVGFCRHDTLECGASADGLVDPNGCIECKCPGLSVHLDNLRSTTIPSEYVAQVQGVMWITERDYCDFVSFNPDFPEHLQLMVKRVQRDDKYIKVLALAVEQFLAEVCEEEAYFRKIAA